ARRRRRAARCRPRPRALRDRRDPRDARGVRDRQRRGRGRDDRGSRAADRGRADVGVARLAGRLRGGTVSLMSGTVPPPAQTWVAGHPRAVRRLGGGIALLAAGVAVGGLPGVLLGIVGTLLALDAVLPTPSGTHSQADDRFRALVRRRRRAQWAARLRGRAPERLEVLDDAAGWAATAEHRALGVRPIAIASVTGTAEALKA